MNRRIILWFGTLIPILFIVLFLIGFWLGYLSPVIALAFSFLLSIISILFALENVIYYSWRKNMTKVYGSKFNEYNYNFMPLFKSKIRTPRGNILFKHRKSLSFSFIVIYENGILAQFCFKNTNPFLKEFKSYDEIYAIYPGSIGTSQKYFALRIESKDLKVGIIPLPFNLDRKIIPLLEKCFGKDWSKIYRKNDVVNLFGEHKLLSDKS
jgi:hypothetical protein